MKNKGVNKQIEQRLRILTGHSNALMGMISTERDPEDVFLQIHALKGSIKGVEDLLIERYINDSLDGSSSKTKNKISYLLKLINNN